MDDTVLCLDEVVTLAKQGEEVSSTLKTKVNVIVIAIALYS